MDESSVYNYIKSLLSLRKANVMKYGDFKKYIISDWVFVMKRLVSMQTEFIIILEKPGVSLAVTISISNDKFFSFRILSIL